MELLLGQIQLFPYPAAPRGWMACEGQLLSIADNAMLSAVLGTQFGGDGHRTFALPDLRGKEPLPHTRYYIAVEGAYPGQ
jgi:microcystin-dependent protein